MSCSMTNFGSETWFGKSSEDVPLLSLDEFSDEVFASYTGPEDGLGFVFRDTSKKNMYMFNDFFFSCEVCGKLLQVHHHNTGRVLKG